MSFFGFLKLKAEISAGACIDGLIAGNRFVLVGVRLLSLSAECPLGVAGDPDALLGLLKNGAWNSDPDSGMIRWRLSSFLFSTVKLSGVLHSTTVWEVDDDIIVLTSSTEINNILVRKT